MSTESSIRGVIFDLDGTLLDTVEDIGHAANQALESKDLQTHPITAYRHFVGHGSLELMRKATVGEAVDEGIVVQLEAAFQAAYEDHWSRTTRPYPGIADLLDAITEKGLPMAVLSNKPHRFTLKCVESLLAGWTFSPTLGQRIHIPKKPDPKAALDIALDWRIPPSDLAFVGDTTIDMETGLKAGMRPIGVSWGFHSKETLAALALPLADSAQELGLLLGL